MPLTWHDRLVQQPSLRDLAQWPAIPINTLPAARRKGFLRNQQIVAEVLDGDAQNAVARRHGVSPARVCQLLARCLGGDEVDSPALSQGLIPHESVAHKRRASPLPRLARPRGPSCAFTALIDKVPGMRAGLDAMIQTKLKDAAYAQRVTPHAFHGEFKRILAENHWPRDCYPYTTVSCGYESVRRYLHTRTAELIRERERSRHHPSGFKVAPDRPFRALRAIQIDEHLLDLNGRIHLLLDDQLIPLRLARASVLVAVDVDTSCILGYYLTPTRAPNQQDMLTLVERCLQPWRPLALSTPGLRYTPGACFPSGLGDEGFSLSMGTVQLDNALMHLAHSVVDLFCQRMGTTLSLGWPATPEVRHRVESIFQYIGQHCSHRIASTTGSSPIDPIKESRKNRKVPPVITFQTLDEALSTTLSDYNVTRKAGLGTAAPLELFRDQCANHYVRFIPNRLAQVWRPLVDTAEVPLRWYRHEQRQPHVTFYYERYQGPGLLSAAGMERRIRVEFDRRDIRTLRAFTLKGKPLGELHAPPNWRRFPHSIATRQHIHQAAKQHRFGKDDPLSHYFRYLLDHQGKPEMALSLLRVYTEFTSGQEVPLSLGAAPKERTTRKACFEWTPDFASHRV